MQATLDAQQCFKHIVVFLFSKAINNSLRQATRSKDQFITKASDSYEPNSLGVELGVTVGHQFYGIEFYDKRQATQHFVNIVLRGRAHVDMKQA